LRRPSTNTVLLAGGRIRGSLCGGAVSPGMRRDHGTFGNLSDETLQDMEQNNDIKFYLIEENRLNELNELSEESLEYNSLNSRRHAGN
jgi:hypothetical protein